MFTRYLCGFSYLLALLILTTPCLAQPQESNLKITVSSPLSATRIYSDSIGESHFEDIELPFELKDFAPPAPPISVTDFIGVEGFVIISSPAGWFGDWHPVPRKQYMFCLTGELEVEVSDGEIRRFGPGDVILVEDTSGKGHVSRVVGEERGYMVAMPVKGQR
jgi:hypothetical protein